MGRKSDSRICIMVIPHTDKVRRLTIPKWLPKASIFAVSTIVIALSLILNNLYTSRLNLAQKHEANLKEIGSLQEENERQKQELSRLEIQNNNLYAKTNEVEDKLMEIDKLQRQLEKIAGLKSSSRGGRIGSEINRRSLEPVEDVQLLKEVLDNKEKELEIFIEDLEKQFEYLETVPDMWPTQGRLTSLFGNRKSPFGRGYGFHNGIDIANASGSNIWAAGRGKVSFSGYKPGLGRTIIIDHGNGYKSVYGHNSRLLVNVGDMVEKGQIISKMGSTGRSTGSHLHFEIHKNGNLVDPLTVLK